MGAGALSMDVQVAAAASDNANRMYIAIGANDNDAGDMAALQAEYEENLAELKISNPSAEIIALNVFRCWTDGTGATEQPKDNIRGAIEAACLAQGVECVDTTNWRDASDTLDGVHNNDSGNAKYATQALALL